MFDNKGITKDRIMHLIVRFVKDSLRCVDTCLWRVLGKVGRKEIRFHGSAVNVVGIGKAAKRQRHLFTQKVTRQNQTLAIAPSLWWSSAEIILQVFIPRMCFHAYCAHKSYKLFLHTMLLLPVFPTRAGSFQDCCVYRVNTHTSARLGRRRPAQTFLNYFCSTRNRHYPH